MARRGLKTVDLHSGEARDYLPISRSRSRAPALRPWWTQRRTSRRGLASRAGTWPS